MKPDQQLTRTSSSAVAKADAGLSIIGKVLTQRDLYALLLDPGRIRKAIELAFNASRHLDPYYDPIIDLFDYTDELMQELSRLIKSGKIDFEREKYFTIPKNPVETRFAMVPNLVKYSLRYLLCMVVAERISFANNIFGGNADIFELTETDRYPGIGHKFNRRQAELLHNEGYRFLVYVDIERFYENVNGRLLLDSLANLLQISPDDPFLQLFKQTVDGISLSYRCDHFLQNIFLHRLDAALAGYDWAYIRLTDDIRVFAKTEAEGKLAYSIIESILTELKLRINHNKCFVLHPIAELGTADEDGRLPLHNDGKRAHIIAIAELEKYPVENNFRICHNSMDVRVWAEYVYTSAEPRSPTYIDEVEGRLGFENETNIFSDFQTSPEPSEDAFWEVLTILHSARGNYRFQYETIRSLILKAINLDSEQALDRLGCIFSFVDVDLKQNVRTYSLYLFLRIWFIELKEDENLLRLKKTPIRSKMLRGIFDLLLKFISQYQTKDSYLLPVIEYIFKERLFIHKDPDTGESSFNKPEFWLKYIHEYQMEEPEKWMNKKAGCMLDFFYEWFHDYHFVLEKARLHYMRKSYKEAVKQFELIPEGMPLLESYLFEIAFSYADIDDHQNALKYYTQYLDKHRSSAAYNNRALIYLELKEYSLAIADLKTAIGIKPVMLYVKNRAVTFAEKDDYYSAILDLNRVISHEDFKPKADYDNYRLRANFLMKSGNIPEGIESLKLYFENGWEYNRKNLATSIKDLEMGIACKS